MNSKKVARLIHRMLFYILSNECISDGESKRTILLKISIKRIKYLGANLIKWNIYVLKTIKHWKWYKEM